MLNITLTDELIILLSIEIHVLNESVIINYFISSFHYVVGR